MLPSETENKILPLVLSERFVKIKTRYFRSKYGQIAIPNKMRKVQLLNPSAAYIFVLCEKKNTLGDIVQLYKKMFRLEEKKATYDVIKCIRRLQSLQLIERG